MSLTRERVQLACLCAVTGLLSGPVLLVDAPALLLFVGSAPRERPLPSWQYATFCVVIAAQVAGFWWLGPLTFVPAVLAGLLWCGLMSDRCTATRSFALAVGWLSFVAVGVLASPEREGRAPIDWFSFVCSFSFECLLALPCSTVLVLLPLRRLWMRIAIALPLGALSRSWLFVWSAWMDEACGDPQWREHLDRALSLLPLGAAAGLADAVVVGAVVRARLGGHEGGSA